MDHTLDQVLVRTILEHAADYPWRFQGIGLLALRLDGCRDFDSTSGTPRRASVILPVHDHPYDFTSTIVVGDMINTCDVEDPAGDEYCRERYSPDDENQRRTDVVHLTGASTSFGPGDQYRQVAAELHSSQQTPGTVTVIRCRWRAAELTVCLRPGAPWVSGQARPAAPRDQRITVAALTGSPTLLGPTRRAVGAFAERSRCRRSAGRLRLRRWGAAGSPLTMGLPGLTGNVANFAFLGERIAGDDLQLVVVDLRGRGHSVVTPPGSYGWENHARDARLVGRCTRGRPVRGRSASRWGLPSL